MALITRKSRGKPFTGCQLCLCGGRGAIAEHAWKEHHPIHWHNARIPGPTKLEN